MSWVHAASHGFQIISFPLITVMPEKALKDLYHCSLFLLQYNIPLYAYSHIYLSILLLIRLDCSWAFSVTSNAAMNILDVYKSFPRLGIYLEEKSLYASLHRYLTLVGNGKLVSEMVTQFSSLPITSCQL